MRAVLACLAAVLLVGGTFGFNDLRLSIDPHAVSISGISSGADMAVQMQVAYSESICGVGVFAGQAYHCAVQRFPNDTLSRKPKDLQSVPYCDGCPKGTTLIYGESAASLSENG